MNKLYALIERYLDGDLSPTEQQEFEQQLHSDPQLSAAFQERQELARFLERQPEKEALQQQLDSLGKEYFRDKNGFRYRKLWPLGAIAAAVLLLLIVRPLLFSPDLYQTYADRSGLQLSVTKSARENTVTQINALLSRQEFEQAYALLRERKKAHPDELETSILLAVCATETERYEESRQLLEAVRTDAPQLANRANWNLALNYLKQEDYQGSIDALNLIEDDSPYAASARTLRASCEAKLAH